MAADDYNDDELRALRRALERDDTPTAPHRLMQPRGRLRRDGVDVAVDFVAGSYEASNKPTPDPPDLELRRVTPKGA